MRTRSVAVTMLVTAALLALPAVAGAGGFATVGLSSLPDGTAPGKPWHVTLTILQHGRTPLSDLQPSVRVASADGQTVKLFAAKPAGKPGTYTADVVFPSAGRWQYSVDDGFTMTHTFAPVAIGASSAVPLPGSQSGAGPNPASAPAAGADDGDGGGGNVLAALGAAVVAGLLAALAAVTLVRRRDGSAGAGAQAAPR
jgi:YtkA-like protein